MDIKLDRPNPKELSNDELRAELLLLCADACLRRHEKRHERQTDIEHKRESDLLNQQYHAAWDEAYKRGMILTSAEEMERLLQMGNTSRMSFAANELCQAPQVEKKFGSLN